jgi:hypothetical protein
MYVESGRSPKCHIMNTEISIFVYFLSFPREVNRNSEVVSASLVLPFEGGKTILNDHNGSSTTPK